MKNLSKAFSSVFYKMSDKTPIVPHADYDESAGSTNDAEATSSSNASAARIVHFPRISEGQPPPSSTFPNNNSNNPNNSSFAYEELMHGSVPCPSCDGSGRIPKEREKQLVALIPFTDKRLKPRRTTLYVMMAVLASVIVCSLCMFFLIPRSITLNSSGFEIAPYYAYINESEQIIKLSFVNEVNITNNNYVAISVVNATMTAIQVFDDKRMVGQATNLTRWTVPLRHRGVVAFNTSITFESGLMIEYCKLVKIIYMQFDVMVTSQYMGHEEQSSLTVNQRLLCSSKPKKSGVHHA